MTIDQYAIEIAELLKSKFDLLEMIIINNNKCILLKYEDMILAYNKFIANFGKYIFLSKELKKQIFKDTRPKVKENPNSHKRHGIINGYVAKLTVNTIESLNTIFKENLDFFEYR